MPEPRTIITRSGASAHAGAADVVCWRTVQPDMEWVSSPPGTGDVVVDAAALPPVDPILLADALDAVPEGIAVFDGDWTIVYVNRAAAGILQRERGRLLGRNIWIALPELGGTILHSFLLHARTAEAQVTWHGYYAPAGRWLNATAVRSGDRLHVSFREAGDHGREDAAVLLGADDEDPADADRERLRYLAEVSEAMISSTLDIDVALAKLLELVVPRMCDWAVVALVGEDRKPTESARAHRDPARVPDMDAYLDRPDPGGGSDDNPMATAFYTGEPIVVHPIPPEVIEPSMTSDEVRAAWARLDTDSFTIAPLRARGETFGGLVLLNTSTRGPHSEMEIATAVEVARRAGLALDNARLYGQQLKVAETLQRSLLTPPPQPDNLEIAVRYQPAAVNMHVGGDWYDAFLQPDGATLLVIGDVVGHNVDAAAAMGQIRSIVRGIAFDRQENPAAILGRVDEVLTGLQIGTMATALIARIEQTPEERETRLRRVRWSSAGHLPPLVRHADGTVETLSTRPEPLLGADIPHTRTDHVARLLPGDTVLFYTDGLVEQGRTGIDEGLDRLVEVFRGLGGALSPDELCDALIDRIVARRSEDDVAIVAVRCHPQT
jgi:sigma-B regulation protein RsbU (phosphoserine phosphatase)